MWHWSPQDFIPLFVLCIPIIAIVGGISAGIVRMIHRQRAFELMQRERIAAIERGLDPEKIAMLQRPHINVESALYTDPHMAAERLRQGLLIGGLVTLFTGIALAVFLNGVTGGHDGDSKSVWMVGMIPAAVGVALLLSAFLIRPIVPSSSTK